MLFGLIKRKPRAPLELPANWEPPRFPAAVHEALQKLHKPNVNISSVARGLSGDPGATVAILRAANTAASGTSREIVSLPQAMSRLGLNRVESVLICEGVQAAMPTPKGSIGGRRFWSQGAYRAAVVEGFFNILEPSRASEAFLSTFLEDLAVPYLANVLDDYPAYWSTSPGAEQAHFGLDHSHVGAAFVQTWGLSETLAEGIASHHEGADARWVEATTPDGLLVGRQLLTDWGGFADADAHDKIEVIHQRAREVAGSF